MTQELDTNMRSLLRARLPPTTCVFRDILEIWGDGAEVSAYLDSFTDPEQKFRAMEQLPVWTHGWCEAHQMWCPYQQSRVRVQGPPCTDWSQAGLGQGVWGPMFKTLMASGKKAARTQAHACVVENVPQLDTQVMEACYSSKFDWVRTLQRPAQVGYAAVARERSAGCSLTEGESCGF